jgi:hypothetical protein
MMKNLDLTAKDIHPRETTIACIFVEFATKSAFGSLAIGQYQPETVKSMAQS